MRDRLDERDLFHLRYLFSILAAHPQEELMVLAVVRYVTRRPGDDPLVQVLNKIDQEMEQPGSTMRSIAKMRSIANALIESDQPNLKWAGETLNYALKQYNGRS